MKRKQSLTRKLIQFLETNDDDGTIIETEPTLIQNEEEVEKNTKKKKSNKKQ